MNEEFKDVNKDFISEIHNKKMELYQNKDFSLLTLDREELRTMTLISLNELRDKLLQYNYEDNIVSIMLLNPNILEMTLRVEWVINQDFVKNEKNYILPLLKAEEQAVENISMGIIDNMELIEIISSLSRYYGKSIYYKNEEFERDIYFAYVKYLSKMYEILSKVAFEREIEEVIKLFKGI